MEKELGTNFYWWKLINHFFNIYSVEISIFNTYQCQMTEAILSHGAPGLFSGFAKYSMTVQQNKKQLAWRWEWRQLSRNFSGFFGRKKLGETIKFFGYIFYRNNSLFSYILSSLQSMLKTICEFCKYFGWIVFANIGLQRFSFKFRRKFCNVISLTHHFIIKSRKLSLRHSCPKICSFAQKGRGTVTWAWVL